MDPIFEFIGKVVAIGGSSAVVAYAIFTLVGRKWLEAIFAERLEAYKHEQNKELEEVRYRINAQFNRITKIHEKEIEVLPEAWIRLKQSIGQLQYFISPGRQYPNLDSMNGAQLEEFLEKNEFYDFEKDKLRQADNKLQMYAELIFFHELHDTRKMAREFHHYIQDNRIFLSNDLKEQFTRIDDLIWEAMTDKEFSHVTKDFKAERKSYKEVQDEIAPLVDNIEALVQKRLQYEDAV